MGNYQSDDYIPEEAQEALQEAKLTADKFLQTVLNSPPNGDVTDSIVREIKKHRLSPASTAFALGVGFIKMAQVAGVPVNFQGYLLMQIIDLLSDAEIHSIGHSPNTRERFKS